MDDEAQDEFIEQEQAGEKAMEQCLTILREHYSTIQIIATKHYPSPDISEGRTTNTERGTGDWFARYGAVGHWLQRQKRHAQQEADEVKRLNEENEDE